MRPVGTPRAARTPHHSSAVALAIVILLASVPAQANIPNRTTSTIPALITLVGQRAGVADPAGTFLVIVRSLSGNPIQNSTVECDFGACPDLKLAAAQPSAGLTVDCVRATVSAITDATGTARLCIVGGALDPGGAPGASVHAARIFADGVLLGYVTAAAVDQDGLDGLTANDLSAWVSDFGAGRLVGRSDYDGSGALGADDLSRWLAFYRAGGSTAGAASLPGGVCP